MVSYCKNFDKWILGRYFILSCTILNTLTNLSIFLNRSKNQINLTVYFLSVKISFRIDVITDKKRQILDLWHLTTGITWGMFVCCLTLITLSQTSSTLLNKSIRHWLSSDSRRILEKTCITYFSSSWCIVLPIDSVFASNLAIRSVLCFKELSHS